MAMSIGRIPRQRRDVFGEFSQLLSELLGAVIDGKEDLSTQVLLQKQLDRAEIPHHGII